MKKIIIFSIAALITIGLNMTVVYAHSGSHHKVSSSAAAQAKQCKDYNDVYCQKCRKCTDKDEVHCSRCNKHHDNIRCR